MIPAFYEGNVERSHGERVLFVCGYREALRSTVLPLCRVLNGSDSDATHVLIDRANDAMAEMCREEGVRFTLRGRPRRPGSTSNKKAPPPIRSATWLAKLAIDLAKCRRRVRRLLGDLDRIRPTTVVLLDDRTHLTCRWIRAAQLRGIPTIVIQWSAIHHADTMIALRAAHQRDMCKPWLVSLVEERIAQLVPRAVSKYQGQLVWFMPADQVLTAWATQTFPRHTPWAFGGGNADAVAVMGPAWQERMVNDGVPESKIVVTGHPEHDRWLKAANAASQHRRRMLDQFDVPADRRLVTLVAPALLMREARGSRLDISLHDLKRSLSLAVDTVAQLGDPFVPVVKVHPRDQLSDLSFLKKVSTRVQIVKETPPHELIAASDAMACQWSTTAMIGAATRTPVILFDFFRTTSAQVWREAHGLTITKEPEEFRVLLRRTLLHKLARHQLLDKQQALANDYFLADGHSTERLVALIRERSQHRWPRRPRAA